jgi:hypothetical protein
MTRAKPLRVTVRIAPRDLPRLGGLDVVAAKWRHGTIRLVSDLKDYIEGVTPGKGPRGGLPPGEANDLVRRANLWLTPGRDEVAPKQ